LSIGGEENVQNIHCMTRMRFTLQDQGRVNRKAIEKAQGTNISGEQFQIIIRNDVSKLYKAIQENSSLDEIN
jgi:beta-glucoside PTS system EIICBA component